MLEILTATAIAVGVGYVSAVFPLVNAEAAALAGGAVTTVPGAVAVSGGLALGQAAGKVTIFLGARGSRHLARRKKAEQALASAHEEFDTPPDTWWGRLHRRLLAGLAHRGTAAGVIGLSAVLGLPPLLIVAALAGTTRMRLLDFTLCCVFGRWIRFAAFALPVALATR